MRAKRSKKYRKIMSSYQLHFSFREPYQVLLDSSFIRTCHAFHMPLQKYLENTLHGQCRIFVTQCTLDKIMKDFERQKQKKGDKRLGGRPEWLPIPSELPLRYCKHKSDEGEELGVLDEARCLLDLLAGQPKGNEMWKNKQHYVLATADEEEVNDKRKNGKQGGIDVRERARRIPGVPIVYVKRSVMVLEELSTASEVSVRKEEREKFKEGFAGGRGVKRKRGEEGEDDDVIKELMSEENQQVKVRRGVRKVKGPNPLSMLKKKVRVAKQDLGGKGTEEEDHSTKPTRRKRGRKKAMHDEADKGAARLDAGSEIPPHGLE